MEQNSEDRILNDLFRRKLESAEVIPSPSTGSRLMRRVAMREFLRFNPSRLNIWYAGAVVVAGTVLSLILTSDPPAEIINSEPEAVEIKTDVPVIRAEDKIINTGKSENESIKQGKSDAAQGRSPGTGENNSGSAITQQTFPESDGAAKVNIPAAGAMDEAADRGDRKLKLFSGNGSYLNASVTEGCAPLKVSFRCLAAAYDSCLWKFGDGGYSASGYPVWLFDMEGEYNVSLLVYSSGIQHQSSVVIKVHPKPEARFEVICENNVTVDDEILFRNYSEGAQKFSWDFGDGSGSGMFEPRHKYGRDGHYNVRLIAISEYGCTDSMVVENAFTGSSCFIEFPNAFIPNPNGPSGGYYSPKSDEVSHIFHPVFSGVSDYQLRIFTRRGVMIFESNDINYGWDGYYKGQLCDPGVYVWKVRGNFINSDSFTRMGDVTLLKN
ncbi:MAG: gliding motility-associated C-terminal domain-containing protein [Bacteroidales bacterium]|nr:gliding motility-associated C-terminal domain-containing protein [Bacteroidales bacterium]